MSLYLPEQKLGSHSEPMSSSHKFMLKGRQTGSMHRGHSWIFRAESHETMMAWFADIKELTEKRGEERNAFVRRSHARSLSGSSFAPSIGGSSDEALKEDEADAVPYSDERMIRTPMTETAPLGASTGADGSQEWRSASQARQRPQPGGRFPSELNVDRGLQGPLSPSSGESSPRVIHAQPEPAAQSTSYGALSNENPQPDYPSGTAQLSDHDALAAASNLPGSGVPFTHQQEPAGTPAPGRAPAMQDDGYTHSEQQQIHPYPPAPQRHDSSYGDWLAPAAAGGIVGAGAGTAAHSTTHPQSTPQNQPHELDAEPVQSQITTSAHPELAPIAISRHTTAFQGTTLTPNDIDDAASHSTGIASVATGTDDPGFGKQAIGSENGRPPLNSASTDKSITTISDLHIPGEYPKNRG